MDVRHAHLLMTYLITTVVAPDPQAKELDVSPRMYRGELVPWYKYPFYATIMASRILKNRWGRHCGGAFISSRWVVTAGHCLPPTKRRGFNVTTELYQVDEEIIKRNQIVSVFHSRPPAVHPDFAIAQENLRWTADIGLFKLSRNGPDDVRPIKLASPSQDTLFIGSERKVTVIAGGRTMLDESYNASWPLKKASFRCSQNLCSRRDVFTLRMPFTMCSPLYPVHQFYPCPGDSGSPVFANDSQEQFLIAIISHMSQQCGENFDSDVKEQGTLQRISQYAPWILHTIDANSDQHEFEDIMQQYMTYFRIVGSPSSPWAHSWTTWLVQMIRPCALPSQDS